VIDTLITHRMRSDGAKEAAEKRKRDGEDIAENIKVTKRLTAGVLVANGLHSLDHPDFLNPFRERQREAAEKQAEFLKKYDNGSRNWLEKLWVEEAYLKYRGPIYHLNYGGTGDIPDGNIPLEDPKKPFNYNHISRFMYGLSKYWQSFKTETVPPQEFRTPLGTDPWSMDCYKKWFSSAQVPGEDMDEIVYNFYTNSEEPKSQLPTDHLMFLVNGHYYSA